MREKALAVEKPSQSVGRVRERRRSASQWAVAWRRFKKNRIALFGLFIVGVFTFIALFAPFLARYEPASVQTLFEGEAGRAPNWKHPFGTTSEGIDVYSDAIYGTRAAFYVGLGATTILMVIAAVMGLVAGYFGGRIDDVLMRAAEVFLVMPILLIVLLFSRVFQLAIGAGMGLTLVVLIMGFFLWPGPSRVIRGEVLRVRELEFIQAERCLGASSSRIIFRHILPNVMPQMIVLSTLYIATCILLEAAISFLGFGDPNVVTWGGLMQIGYYNFVREWWTEIFPGLMLLTTVLGFNLLGDGLNDALNPRLRE